MNFFQNMYSFHVNIGLIPERSLDQCRILVYFGLMYREPVKLFLVHPCQILGPLEVGIRVTRIVGKRGSRKIHPVHRLIEHVFGLFQTSEIKISQASFTAEFHPPFLVDGLTDIVLTFERYSLKTVIVGSCRDS